MIVIVLTALFAQEVEIPYMDLLQDSARLLNFTVALSALEEEPSLLDLHRGLSAYLDEHPALALTERAYRQHLRSPTFRRVSGAFEEALHQDESARTRFDAYYGALASSGTLNAKVDALYRIEMREGRRDSWFPAAMAYLRSHPEEALIFLDNPRRLLPTPGDLYALRTRFRNDRDLQAQLNEAFQELDQEAAAHQYVLPWWEEAFDASGAAGTAYLALSASFSRFPQRFWVWHRRHAAWSAQPVIESWLWHFYGRIRRNAALRDTYFDFLEILRENPALSGALEGKWNEVHGAPPTWPPEGPAPELPALADSLEGDVNRPNRPERPSRDTIVPRRPTVPRSQIQVPERPVPPTPARPDTPVREEADGTPQ